MAYDETYLQGLSLEDRLKRIEMLCDRLEQNIAGLCASFREHEHQMSDLAWSINYVKKDRLRDE
jgi:hypothetical protein